MAESLRVAAQSAPKLDRLAGSQRSDGTDPAAEGPGTGLEGLEIPGDAAGSAGSGRWSSRFALAAVSLAGLVGSPGAARAAVQYGYGPLSIGLQSTPNSQVNWDVDGNSSNDFALSFTTTFTGTQGKILIKGINSNGILGSTGGQISKISTGFVVHPNSPFASSAAMISATNNAIVNTIRLGPIFQEFSTPGFFGFRFSTDGNNYNYGYAALSLDLVQGIATITAWAWETTANASITVGPIPPTPAPAALGGLLALGAGGLRRLRALRRAAASADSTASPVSGEVPAPLNL